MGTANHGVIMDYDTTKPGRNFPDEAKRATADLARLAGRWITIAEVNEELLNPTEAISYDNESGEELPIRRPPVNIGSNTRREDFEREVSEFWPVWIAGWERAQDALNKITYPEVSGMLLEARLAMVELGRIFNPQVSPAPDHRLGHHLSRPGGVLYCRAGGRCRVRRAQIEEIVRPLEQFSDLIGTYDNGQSEEPPALANAKAARFPLESAPHPRPDEKTCWTKTTLASVVGVVPSTLWRWTSVLGSSISAKGKGDLLTRGDLEAIANARFEAGNRIQGERIRFAARS